MHDFGCELRAEGASIGCPAGSSSDSDLRFPDITHLSDIVEGEDVTAGPGLPIEGVAFGLAHVQDAIGLKVCKAGVELALPVELHGVGPIHHGTDVAAREDCDDGGLEDGGQALIKRAVEGVDHEDPLWVFSLVLGGDVPVDLDLRAGG